VLRLLESDCHGQRLRDLLSRFREQEVALCALLVELAEAIDHAQEATCRAAAAAAIDHHARLADCTALQIESDGLTTELVHVRMAIAGTHEELTDHDQRRFRAAPDAAVAAPA